MSSGGYWLGSAWTICLACACNWILGHGRPDHLLRALSGLQPKKLQICQLGVQLGCCPQAAAFSAHASAGKGTRLSGLRHVVTAALQVRTPRPKGTPDLDRPPYITQGVSIYNDCQTRKNGTVCLLDRYSAPAIWSKQRICSASAW